MSEYNQAVDLSVSSPEFSQKADSPTAKPKKKASVLPTFLPPCRVCNATASGYHYGANTCEACKAFFRRSIGNEASIKPCNKGGQCAKQPTGKISCSDCRHKKCLSIGMAREGCRKGRYTYEKRTQDTKEIRKMQAEATVYRQFEHENVAEVATLLSYNFITNFPEILSYFMDEDKINAQVQTLFDEHALNSAECVLQPMYSPGHTPSAEVEGWFEALIEMYNNWSLSQNHYELEPIQDKLFQAWVTEVERTFHQLTSFAKLLPGFNDLLLDDRIILLKTARTDSMNFIRHKTHDPQREYTVHYNSTSGDILIFPSVIFQSLFGHEFFDSLRKVTRRLHKLNLVYEDVAVLLGFVILMSDREGLHRSDQVERLHDKMLPVLEYTLRKNHPHQKNILADTLLILPMLRESACIHRDIVEITRNKVDPRVAPLVCEMLQG